MTCENVAMSDLSKSERIRLQVFGVVVLVCVASGFEMFASLFVSIPKLHSGSKPSNYFSGSSRSVARAVQHGAVALVIHTFVGFLLAVMVIGVVAHALSLGRRSITTWSVLGALCTIGAGFNGASFLDYHKNASFFVMAVLALAALLCFAVVVYLAPLNAETTVEAGVTG
jgi:hypothetical protein